MMGLRDRFFLHGFACCLILVSVIGCAPKETNTAATITGTHVNLAGSDWLVVNYWAEWCGPCRHEIPELNQLDGDSAGADESVSVKVIGVNYDGLRDQKLADVSTRMGIEFAVLAEDPRVRWGQEAPAVLPSTYIVAPGGDFVETLVGPQTRVGILSRIETLAAARAES